MVSINFGNRGETPSQDGLTPVGLFMRVMTQLFHYFHSAWFLRSAPGLYFPALLCYDDVIAELSHLTYATLSPIQILDNIREHSCRESVFDDFDSVVLQLEYIHSITSGCFAALSFLRIERMRPDTEWVQYFDEVLNEFESISALYWIPIRPSFVLARNRFTRSLESVIAPVLPQFTGRMWQAASAIDEDVDVPTLLEDVENPEEFEVPNDCTERGYNIYQIMASYNLLYSINTATINEYNNYTVGPEGTWYSSACMSCSNNDYEPPGYVSMEEQMIRITFRFPDSDSESDGLYYDDDVPIPCLENLPRYDDDLQSVVEENPLNWDMSTPTPTADDSEWTAAERLLFDIETHPGPCVVPGSYYVGLASLSVWNRTTFIDTEFVNGYCQDFPCVNEYNAIHYSINEVTYNDLYMICFNIILTVMWLLLPLVVLSIEKIVHSVTLFLNFRFMFRLFEQHLIWRASMMRGVGPYSVIAGLWIWYTVFGVVHLLNPLHFFWISATIYGVSIFTLRQIVWFMYGFSHYVNSHTGDRGPWIGRYTWFLFNHYICSVPEKDIEEVPYDDDEDIVSCVSDIIDEYVDTVESAIIDDSPPSWLREQMDGESLTPLHPEWASFEHTQDRVRLLKVRRTILRVMRKHEKDSVGKAMLKYCVASLNEYFSLHPKEECRMAEHFSLSDLFKATVGMDPATQATFLQAANDLSHPKVEVNVPLLTSLKDQIVACYEKPEMHQLGLYFGYLALLMAHENGWSKASIVGDGIHLYTIITHGLTSPGSLAMGATRVAFKLSGQPHADPVVRPKIFFSVEEWEDYEEATGGKMGEHMEPITWEDSDTKNVVEPLLGLVWFTMFGKAAAKGQFSSFMDSAAKMPAYEKGITWSVEFFIRMLAKFAEWIPENYDFHGIVKSKSLFPELDEIVKEVEEVVKLYRTPEFRLDSDMVERLFYLDKKINKLYADRDLRDNRFPEARKILTRVSQSLKVVLDYATSHAKGAHCKRQKPVGVVLCGESGVGKSHVTMALVQKLLMRCLPACLIEPCVKNYMAFVNFVKFGYNFIPGFKRGYITVVNEFGAMEDVKGQNFTGIVDLLHFVDEAPHVVEAASLNEKDNQYMDSKFVVINTNRTSWKDFYSIHFPKALNRRFLVFTVFPKLEYCTPESVEKYEESNCKYDLKIKDASVMPIMADGGPVEDCYEFMATDFNTGTLVGPVYNIEQLEDMLVSLHDRNREVFYNNSESDRILRVRALKKRSAETGEKFPGILEEQGFFSHMFAYFYPARDEDDTSEDDIYDEPVASALEDLADTCDCWLSNPTVQKVTFVLATLGALYVAWSFARVHLVEQSFEPKVAKAKRPDKRTRMAQRMNNARSTVHQQVDTPAEEHMHQFRSNALNIATKVCSQNVYDVLHHDMEKNTWHLLGRCIFICGRICLIPKHYVREFNKIVKDGHTLRLGWRPAINSSVPPIEVEWNLIPTSDVQSHPHLDWSLVKLPKVIDEKALITHLFAPRSMDLTEEPLWSSMLRCNDKGFAGVPTMAEYSLNETYGEWDKTTRKFVGDYTTCAEGFHVQVPCDKGDCGFPYLLTDQQYPQPVIFGIHTAGHNGMNHGYAAAVYKDDIDDLLAKFGPMQTHLNPHVPDEYGPYPPVPHMMLCGYADPVHQSTKSEIVPAPLYGLFGEPTKSPSRLSRLKDDKGEWIEPMHLALVGYSKNEGYVNPILYEDCAHAQIKFIFEHSTPVPVEKGVISYEEAVLGRPGVYKGIDMSTSCGYGFSNKGITKKDLFFDGDQVNLNKPEAQALKRVVLDLEKEMSDRIYTPDIIIDTLKSELLSKEKVAEGRSRMFNVYQIHRYILARMYFMPFIVWVVENCMHNGFTLGMNVYTDFDVFRTHITSRGSKVISGDVKWFDKKQMIIGFHMFFDFVNTFYIGCCQKEKNVRDMLMCAVMRTIHVQKDWSALQVHSGRPQFALVEWFGSLTSGWLLTAHGGSFMNGTNLMYCIMDTKLLSVGGAEAYDGTKPIDWDEFWRNVRIFKNGDDNIINVSDEWALEVTQTSMMKSSAKIDMVYTPEHKGAITVEHRAFTDIEYLKRMWVYHPDFDFWAAALRPESIIEMLNWTGRVFNKKDYELLIERALAEWSAWGEEEFNARFPSINEASIRKLNYVPINNTYAKAFRAYMGTEVQGYF